MAWEIERNNIIANAIAKLCSFPGPKESFAMTQITSCVWVVTEDS
jgi:hypothetical protein